MKSNLGRTGDDFDTRGNLARSWGNKGCIFFQGGNFKATKLELMWMLHLICVWYFKVHVWRHFWGGGYLAGGILLEQWRGSVIWRSVPAGNATPAWLGLPPQTYTGILMPFVGRMRLCPHKSKRQVEGILKNITKPHVVLLLWTSNVARIWSGESPKKRAFAIELLRDACMVAWTENFTELGTKSRVQKSHDVEITLGLHVFLYLSVLLFSAVSVLDCRWKGTRPVEAFCSPISDRCDSLLVIWLMCAKLFRICECLWRTNNRNSILVINKTQQVLEFSCHLNFYL